MKYLVLLFFVLTVGCAEVTRFTDINDQGYFILRDENIQVRAPTDAVWDMFVFKNEGSVEFVTGRGYWMASASYKLSAFEARPLSEDVFQKKAVELLNSYLINEPGLYGLHTEIYNKAKYMTINGNPAEQAISIDLSSKIPGIMVATVIRFNEYVVIASALYPVKRENQDTPENSIDWNHYNNYLNSIKYVNQSTVSLTNKAIGTPAVQSPIL